MPEHRSVGKRPGSGPCVSRGLPFYCGILCLAAAFIAGCGKPPTFNELVGNAPKDPPANSAPTQAPVVAPPKSDEPPPPPPKPDPATVIAAFQKRPSPEVDDGSLNGLAAMEEGIELVDKLNLAQSRVTENSLVQLPKFVGCKDLDLSRVSLTPKSLEAVGQMTALERLNLGETSLTTEACAALADLVNLRELRLNVTAIDDQAFKHFTKLVNLEVLNVSQTRIDGSGFVVFDKMGSNNHLRILSASQTGFGNHGFKYVKGWGQLEELRVDSSGVTDQALAMGMKGMVNLTLLDISANPVTDVCVRSLAPLKKLQTVYFRSNMRISDQGVSQLKGHKELKHLDLEQTSCTANIGPFLRKTCPDVKVVINGQTY